MSTSNNKYFVSVDGAQAPSVEHTNIEDAKREAERLSRIPSNSKRAVRVLQQVAALVPMQMPTHAWEANYPTRTEAQIVPCATQPSLQPEF